MDSLPIFLNIRDRACLIVGGGSVAARKAMLIRRAGGNIMVIAPHLSREMQALIDSGSARHQARRFEDEDVKDQVMVIAATNDVAVNRNVARLAKARNMPVNVVNDSSAGTFVLPCVVDRSPVQIAISTGGASPVLTRELRTRIETCIPAAYGRLAGLVQAFRQKIKHRLPNATQRRRFWEQTLQGPIAEAVLAGREAVAREMLEASIDSATDNAITGEVYLVGAGPGDPDLLTFRALRLMQQADVVVYDRLVSTPILELVRRGARRIYAGKYPRGPRVAQEDINALLVRLAKAGERVLRLKGGDPFVFGRGGEEIASLVDEGVSFQVVPGITAANGCAAYAGIPLTHRDYAQACIFVTGHRREGTNDLNWPMLAHEQQTLVFYMGLLGVDVICHRLIAHGLPASTPAAMIAQGTTPHQRVLIGDLASLPRLVANSNVHAPTLIIVGQVVRLHEKLRWFKLPKVPN